MNVLAMDLVVAILAAALLVFFRLRDPISVVLSHKKMISGDYEGALRLVRRLSFGMPSVPMLHRQGLTYALAGRPAEAEDCYRRALSRGASRISPRERLLASLGYALQDQGRYEEAERCFHQAIEAGDHTGNSQDGLAELRLVQGIDPHMALHLAGQAIQHAKRRPGGRVPEVYFAHQAWALALLGRVDEARESVTEALRTAKNPTRAAEAGVRWRAAMALLAMKETAQAIDLLRDGYKIDPTGKYGRCCHELLQRSSAVSA